MNTIEEIKKKGWTEVEQKQKELARLKERLRGKPYEAAVTEELVGRIQGMVFILNMMK